MIHGARRNPGRSHGNRKFVNPGLKYLHEHGRNYDYKA